MSFLTKCLTSKKHRRAFEVTDVDSGNWPESRGNRESGWNFRQDDYMAEGAIKKEVLEVAVRLVAERRRRHKRTPDRWTRYAGVTLVECPLRHCKADEKIFGTRREASIHVHGVHPDGEYGGDLNRIELTQPFSRRPWQSIQFGKAARATQVLAVDLSRREGKTLST